jgi:hypothetical protein
MSPGRATIWKQMYDAKKIPNRAFSLCMGRSPTASRKGTESGAMSLGGTDATLHKTNMVFSQASISGYYGVTVRKAYLRAGNSGDSAANPTKAKVVTLGTGSEILPGRLIVDSGTTDTFFHKKFGEVFYAAFQELSGKEYTTGMVTLTKEELDSFPTILLQLKGDVARNKAAVEQSTDGTVVGLAGDLDSQNPYDVILAIPPSHYFDYAGHDLYAARFYADQNSDISVLGANFMMGHDVLFDIDNRLLGWAESECDYTSMVEKYVDGGFPLPDELTSSSCVVSRNAHINREFCTILRCRTSSIVVLVCSFFFLCMKMCCIRKRRSSSTEQAYESLTASELEMQTPPSALNEHASYRDDDGSDDEVGTEPDESSRRVPNTEEAIAVRVS